MQSCKGVKRDEFCAGLLLKNDSRACRRIGYKVLDGASIDLAYPFACSYAIDGFQPVIDVPDDFIINYHTNLGPLLKEIDITRDKEILMPHDIDNVFNLLLKGNGAWLDKNIGLFYPGMPLVPIQIYNNLRIIIDATRKWWPQPSEPNYPLIKRKR